MQKLLLLIFLLSLVACNSSGPSLQNQQNAISPKEQAVKEFDTGRYLTDVIAELEVFDLQAFAKHIKSEEQNETLQKLKFRAGVRYYLSALDSINRLRGGGKKHFSQKDIEKMYHSFTDTMSAVEMMSYSNREAHLPGFDREDPLESLSKDKNYEKEEFKSAYNYNCYRFFNNFNLLMIEAKKSMAQLILLRNNESYTGLDSFRGGLAEFLQKQAISQHVSHWFKTGAISDESIREQNLLMHQARLDAIDMLIRTNIIFSANNSEGGGGFGGQSCIGSTDKKLQWQKKITELGLKMEYFYNTYFGVQSVKSRGETLSLVAQHTHDKVIWENWKIAGVEAILSIPAITSLRVLGGILKSSAQLISKKSSQSTLKKATKSEVVRKSARSEFARLKNLKSQYVNHVGGFADAFDFLLYAGKEFLVSSAMFGYRFSKNYLDDMVTLFKGQTDAWRVRKLFAVALPIGTLTMAFYMAAESYAADELSDEYKPMLSNYDPNKDYAVIESDLRLADSGQLQREITSQEWIDFNRGVEELLNSHIQSPKIYLKLMDMKYDFYNKLELQHIQLLYEVFPNIKEDIRRHGNMDATINYYLQLEKGLSEELNLESMS